MRDIFTNINIHVNKSAVTAEFRNLPETSAITLNILLNGGIITYFLDSENEAEQFVDAIWQAYTAFVHAKGQDD